MEPGPLERYQIGLRVAKDAMRRLGRTSIDGREPHDIAMQSVFSENWRPQRIRFDVIDAYRKERGRSAKGRTARHHNRIFQSIPFALSTRDPERNPDWLDGWRLTPGEMRIALLISQGLTKSETARWLGITQTAVYLALQRIRKRNPCQGNTNLENSPCGTNSSTSPTGTSDGHSSSSPSPDAPGSGRS